MGQPIDILDERERMTGPFAFAVFLHIGVVMFVLGYGIYAARLGPQFGDPNPAGGMAVAVTPVQSIPIPHRQGPQNPVANDTNSVVPAAPAKQEVEKRQPIPDKNAVAIPDRTPKKVAEQPRHKQTYVEPPQPNQVNSRVAPATVNPMYSMSQGGTGVGIGPNSLLGQQYGWYAEMVRKIIARNWVTSGLAGHQASAAIVGFVISRTGSVSDVKLVQPSGNPAIDNSALRAVYNSNPLPALPAGFAAGSAPAESTFDLR
jgi:periplasmic protein TonB